MTINCFFKGVLKRVLRFKHVLEEVFWRVFDPLPLLSQTATLELQLTEDEKRSVCLAPHKLSRAPLGHVVTLEKASTMDVETSRSPKNASSVSADLALRKEKINQILRPWPYLSLSRTECITTAMQKWRIGHFYLSKTNHEVLHNGEILRAKSTRQHMRTSAAWARSSFQTFTIASPAASSRASYAGGASCAAQMIYFKPKSNNKWQGQ